MASRSRLPESVHGLLRCPRCRQRLRALGDEWLCEGAGCGLRFPVVDGVPVLIDEAASLFSIDSFVARRDTYFKSRDNGLASRVREALRRLVPSIGTNRAARANYDRLERALFRRSERPRVLVIGGGLLGEGMESLARRPDLELIETDVSLAPRTMLICDAHDLPFDDASFDAVIAQAVLEHVADPYRCVAEIHRVLVPRGQVYAETPFMQQVHGGRYDFTRFTHLGHRRLFRRFEEIDSGPAAGPGTALAWAWQYFLLSFTTSKVLRDLIMAFAGFTSFFLKYFDAYLIGKPGALDAASAYYFLGEKSTDTLSDRELAGLYKGAL